MQLKENAETRLIGFGLSGHKEHRIILPYTDFGVVTLPERKSLETLSKGDVIHVIGWDGKPGLFDGTTYCEYYLPHKSRSLLDRV